MSLTLLHLLYAALAPWLALALLLLGRNPYPSALRITLSLLLPAGFLLLPIQHFFLVQWILLLEPNPSITLASLLALTLLSRAGGPSFLRPQDWNAAWLFGAAASLILYPMALGLTRFDPYAWGWGTHLPLAVAAITTVLLFTGNRFGLLLLLALLGMLFPPMESRNHWDCLLDPFYGGVSLIISLCLLYKISTGHCGSARRKALP
jgi:hypothetical protein